MKRQTKEELIDETGGLIMKSLIIMGFIGLLCMITSLYFWIWIGWDFAYKTFLTGFITLMIFGLAYKEYKKMISESVDEIWPKLNDLWNKEDALNKSIEQSKTQ